MASSTGTSLRDFRILAALGKGSYGSVSKAERLADGCIYAMKEVNIRRLSARERCVSRPFFHMRGCPFAAGAHWRRSCAAAGAVARRCRWR